VFDKFAPFQSEVCRKVEESLSSGKKKQSSVDH
jgi:hypothetical protein